MGNWAERAAGTMSAVHPDLDVIIVSYNSAHVIADLLDSLPAALDGLTAAVVIVDNGSTDGTAELVEARGDCRVVRSANVGYAGGINRGVREAARASAILILNPDVRMQERSVRPLLAALSEPDVGVVVPQVRSAQGALELSLRREPTLLRAMGLNRTRLAALSEYVAGPEQYLRPCSVDWALGAVLLISRPCYDALGGMDESYFLYSEETDLSLRARDAGMLTRYEPRSVVVHIGGGSGRDHKTHTMQVVNRVRLYRRRNGVLASWCYYWLTIVSETTWIMRGHRQSRTAIAALLRPARRPAELGCSDRMMPR
jgi:N-acetylglucosaminyl-diphospho-decaprenol L-rhamnosyltransferase